MSMSLIPYQPREGREIVLRHYDAIVVHDTASQSLQLRALAECPTCHQPLRASSPERGGYDAASTESDTYVDPNYFRMLHAGPDSVRRDHPPSSPIRRLVDSLGEDNNDDDDEGQDHRPHNHGVFAHDIHEVPDAEFISSAPVQPQEGSRIRREAFQPNYFKTFFVEERELGRGGKGVVLLVRHEIDGCQLGHFACKRVPVGNDHAWLEKVLVEVELLAKLSHPNLVSYRHVWLEDVKLNRFGPSVACAFILQQYCNAGDLLNYVIGSQPKEATVEELKAQARRRSKGQGERPQSLWHPQRQLQIDEIYSLFKDITSGLAYLHAANYIHRDLKPSNCLLHKEGHRTHCLISDFGEVQPENVMRKSTGSTGTISYCAPEVLRRDAAGRYGNFTAKSDIFSLGMILYFMCFGRLPYRAANTVQEELEDIDLLRAEITDWKGFQDEKRERPDLPSRLYQLLKKLLAVDPNERPTAKEVLNALKSESSMDGMTQSAHPTSIGLRGRRIQSLDSPAPPGTPVPDPEKRATVATARQDDHRTTSHNEDSPQPTIQNSLQKLSLPATPRHRAHGSTPHSPERHSAHVSPERRNGSPTRARPRHNSPAATTALLLPPPTTLKGELWHRAAVAHHRVIHFVAWHIETLAFLLRLALFLTKMASLARPCWPYTVNMSVSASLIAMAGLDLGVPSSRSRGAALSRANAQSAGMHDVAASHWVWDYRASLTLFVLHFLAMWMMSRWGILCPASHERWADWDPQM